MPNNNYNYGAGYIMGQDKQSVDQNVGETQLYPVLLAECGRAKRSYV
jgi:hypothetical protein